MAEITGAEAPIEKRQITHETVEGYLHLHFEKGKKKALFLTLIFALLCLPSGFLGFMNLALYLSGSGSDDLFRDAALPLLFCLVFGGYLIGILVRRGKEKRALKKREYVFYEDKLMDTFLEVSRSRYGRTERRYFVFQRFGKFFVDTELSNAYAESVLFDEFYLLCIGESKPRILHVYNKAHYELSPELAAHKR